MENRRFALYFSWSRPKEIGSDIRILENRFPTLFEFRRAMWPMVRELSDISKIPNQGIEGFLDHIVLMDFGYFNKIMTSITGHPVSVIQREGGDPPSQQLDESFLREVDTLIVVSLDHFRTNQEVSAAEVEAIKHFLEREEACLIVCPHHDIGATDNFERQLDEYRHHGDVLVPSQQRIGGFALSLLKALGIPVRNHFGLNPAKTQEGNPAPLDVLFHEDSLKILDGVRTFNLHPHLPHFHIDVAAHNDVRVLARQEVSKKSRHPFTEAGNNYFNAFCWIPAKGRRAGNVFICDATLWSSAFKGLESLYNLWLNLARM